MLKFLFYSLLFFYLVRFINRLFLPKVKRKSPFNPFFGNGTARRNRFDQIEDAEYEVVSEKEK